MHSLPCLHLGQMSTLLGAARDVEAITAAEPTDLGENEDADGAA